MRTVWVLVAMIAAAACGPSSAEVRTAREAHYVSPAIDLFEEVEAAVEGSYKIAQSDMDQLALVTQDKWFNAEGAVSTSALLTDGAYDVQFLVQLYDEDGQVRVEVTPIVRIVHQGQTQLEEVSPTSPKIPGWVTGRVDSLYVAIHGRLKGKVATPAPAP